MARNTLMIVSNNGEGIPHQFRIFDEAGALQAGPIAATGGPAGSNLHFVTVPAATPTRWYAFGAYRTSNDAVRGGGQFYWDNADQCIVDTEENELTAAEVETSVGNALTTYGAATATDVANAETNILAAIPSAAAIAVAVEAAIINDADGQTALAAIAAAVESAIGNEADGNATLAAFQGAVTAALVAYDPPTNAELTSCCNAIQADIAALADLDSADIIAALGTYGAATTADVVANAGLTTGQAAILTLIRDIAEADEVYNSSTGVAQKLLKGTATVLVDKVVSTNTVCVVDTTLTEAP